MKRMLVVGVVVLVLFVIGCASIIHGTKQEISVNSVPSGAMVTVKGVHMASTPAVIELKRKESNVVLRFEKEGYEPVEIALRRSASGWLWGNIAFGGLIGLVVDFATGAAYKLNPADVNVIMTELKKSGMNLDDMSKDGVVIAVDMQVIKK